MSNFDLNKSCSEQGLTPEQVKQCQEAKKNKSLTPKSSSSKDIDAPVITGPNLQKYRGKILFNQNLDQRRELINKLGFNQWQEDFTGGGEIIKGIADGWKNVDSAVNDFTFGKMSQDKIDLRKNLMQSTVDNFKSIYEFDKFEDGKKGNSISDALNPELLALWQAQDGYEDKFADGFVTTPKKGSKRYESYKKAFDIWEKNKTEQADNEIIKQYGVNVLDKYKESGRDASKLNINDFDKDYVDGLMSTEKSRIVQRYLKTTGLDGTERELDAVLYPALDKYIYGEGDKDEDGFLPNERIAYDNQQMIQDFVNDGCMGIVQAEDVLKPGEEYTAETGPCKGRKIKLKSYKTGDEYIKYKEGLEAIGKRGGEIESAINTAMDNSKGLLDDLTDLQKKLEGYGIVNGRTSKGIIPSPEIQAAYNADLKKYQELATQYTSSPEGKALEKLRIESTLLEEEYKKLEKMGEKYSNVAMILEAGMLNYSLLDKTFATLSSSFIDPVAGLMKQIDAELGRAVGSYDDIIKYDDQGNVVEEGEEGYEDGLTRYERERGASMNYFKMGSERMNQFSASLGSADFGKDGFSVGRYLLEMAADNSPSILAVMGPSAVAGMFGRMTAKGLTGMAARNALSKSLAIGNNVTQGLFFVSGSADQWGKLTLASYEGDKKLKEIGELLKNDKLTAAERNGLLKEQNFYLQTKDDGILRRGISSLLYGGADMFAERYIGSMRVINNLQKLGPAYKSRGLFGAWRKSSIDGLKSTLGASYRFSAGIGAELLEESFVNLATAFVDKEILQLDRGYLDDFSTDFALNTAFTSVVMQGPFMAQNVMGGLRYELSTAADRKRQRTIHGSLMGIQDKLNRANELKLTPTEVNQLEAQKEDLFNQSTIADFLTFNSWTKLDETQRNELVDLGGEIRKEEKILNELTSDPQFGEKGLLKDIKASEARLKDLDAKKADILKSKKLDDFKKQAEDARKEDKTLKTVDDIIGEKRIQLYEAALDITSFQFDGDMEVIDNDAKLEEYIKNKENKLKPADVEKLRSGKSLAFVNPSTGQIVINQKVIYDTLMNVDTTTAFTAAIAPLHELLHVQIKKTGIFDTKGNTKLQSSIEGSVLGLRDLIKSKQADGQIDDSRANEILKRIDQYKGKDGKYNVEEVLTTFSEAVIAGDLKKSDFAGLFGVKSMLNSVFAKMNGGPSTILNPFTDTNSVFQFVSDFTNKLGDVNFTVNQTYTMDSTGRMKRQNLEDTDQNLKLSQVPGDIKSELDKFVQNEDGSKKYESKENFQKSKDYGDAMNQIENTNLLDGLVRQNVSQEYLDMNPEFVQEAKQRIGEKFMNEFDPNKNESLFGWLTGPTVGGQAILGFAKGDVQNKGKQQVETKSIDDPNAREVAEQKIDETTTTKKDVTPTISAFDFLKKSDPNFDTKKFEQEFTNEQNKLAKEKGINLSNPNLTAKERMEVVPYKVLADAIGIPVKKLTDPKANLTPDEASKAQRVLIAAKPFIKNVVLSKANTDVTTVESKKKGGKPVKVGGDTLGLGTKILNTFFNPPKRLGSGKKVRTPKRFDNKKFDEAIGVKDGKVSPDFDARNSQIIKGLLKAVAEQMGGRATSKTLKKGPQTQDVKKTQAALDSMKGDLVFSMAPDQKVGKQLRTSLSLFGNVGNLTVGQNFLDFINQKNNTNFKALPREGKKYKLTPELKAKRKAWVRGLAESGLFNKDFFWSKNFANSTRQLYSSMKELNADLKGIKFDNKNKPRPITQLYSGKTVGEIKQMVNSQKFKDSEAAKLPYLKEIALGIQQDIKNNPENIVFWTALFRDAQDSTGHFLRSMAPMMFYSNVDGKFVEEHSMPASSMGNFILASAALGNINNDFDFVTKNYFQGALLKSDDKKMKGPYFNYIANMPPAFFTMDNLTTWVRYNNPNVASIDGGINFDNYQMIGKDITVSQEIAELGMDLAVGKIEADNVLENGIQESKTPEIKDKLEKLNTTTNLDKGFNDILQDVKGIKSEARFSDIGARRAGRGKGRFRFFLPPGAEDFKGLIYNFLGKGKKGEQQFEFFDKNLIKPYQQAIAQIERFRRSLKNDYATLLKASPEVRKKLGKKIPGGNFTYDQAVRAFLMDKSGFDLKNTGLSKRDAKLLIDTVKNDPEVQLFAEGLQLITKQDTWLKPNGGFDVQTIQSDLNRLTSSEGRKKFLENSGFMQNSSEIFSKANLNKIEAAYGIGVREAIEDMMYRMKNGTNRPSGSNRLTNAFNNWVNRSIGAIMFFNRKSALLQTISSVNFINWSDNNPLKAAMAFANQKQYWTDFAMIFNSPKLKERRAGLKGDINEAELASAVEGATNKAEAALSWLLKKGFLPTQMADSFAIASGGATFYRNRVNTYIKQGMDQKAAEEKAFEDFSRVSEESQQSADPSMISEQQASPLGRLILAFQNTPMQYTRLMKRSAQDLLNGRGDAKTHVSKIIYYGAIQNFIFSALQNALFATIPGFSGEDEEDEETKKQREEQNKYIRIANNMVDTVLRGSGIYGAIGATLKNTLVKFYQNEGKDPFAKDNADIILEAVNLSPPIGSKLRKLNNALKTREFEKDVIEERGWEITRNGRVNLSPSYRVLGSTAEAVLNIPLERTIAEISALTEMTDSRNSSMERIALALGWRTWDLGIRNEEHDQIKLEAKERKKEERKKKLQFEREEKKRLEEEKRFEGLSNKEINNLKRRDQIESLTKQQQVDSLVKLGVSKALIRSLRLESDRIDKIIELNTK